MKLKLSIAFIVLACFTQCKTSKNVFDKDISNFKRSDSLQTPGRDMILFIGSSSFTLWKNVKEDLQNESIVNRAFGGSTLLDLLHYKKDIIDAYTPRKIVIYCGDNDIASSVNVRGKDVFLRFKKLYKKIRTKFPAIPVVYISIKPSPARWKTRDRMIEANTLIADYINSKKNIVFVNVWDKMLNENGYPKAEIFTGDSLHMNKKGYEIWIKELKAVL